jgi:hypothetical protein
MFSLQQTRETFAAAALFNANSNGLPTLPAHLAQQQQQIRNGKLCAE